MKTKPPSIAYVVIAHGSRESKSNQAFLRLVARLRAHLSKSRGNCFVIGAFLEIARPSIQTAIEKAVAKKVRDVVVVPLLLFPGRHAAKDIPAFLQEAARHHPGIRFRLKSSLALHRKFLGFLREVL